MKKEKKLNQTFINGVPMKILITFHNEAEMIEYAMRKNISGLQEFNFIIQSEPEIIYSSIREYLDARGDDL